MPTIDHDGAAAVRHAIETQARASGVPVSIAVVDDVGALVEFVRLSGAPRFSADFAVAKARTAATFAVETSHLEELYADRPAFAVSFVARGDYFLGRGGVPVFRDGELIGAVGVSGADAHGEERLARVGASAVRGETGD